jgi:hypothetical protein
LRTYTTVLGDTFDKIALEQLGSEYLFPLLLKDNPQHRMTLVFSAGVLLNIPEVTPIANYQNAPDWLGGPEELKADMPSEDIVVLHGIDA